MADLFSSLMTPVIHVRQFLRMVQLSFLQRETTYIVKESLINVRTTLVYYGIPHQ